MKPNIYRKCSNYDCSEYDKEILLKEEDMDAFSIDEYCDICHKKGELRYSHKGIEGDSARGFYAIVSGLAKEYHLLKRMIDKGIAEKEDEARFTEIHEQIKELECTGCGQLFTHHEH